MPNAISRFFRWAYSLLRKGNNYYDYGVIALQQRINDDVMVPVKNYSDFLYKKYLYSHLFGNIFSSFIHFSSEKLLKKDLSFRKIDIFADDKVAQ